MRILIAHEALAGAGGVESYLAMLIPALRGRGHEVAVLHFNPRAQNGPTRLDADGVRTFGVSDSGLSRAVDQVRAWSPDVCFSHNMRPLAVDDALTGNWPTVKMMHGYFGTCISGHKCHAAPRASACTRTIGPACMALYLPRRCGQLRPWRMVQDYEWALRQRQLFDRYAGLVVASSYMADEYVRNGMSAKRLSVLPLFPTVRPGGLANPAGVPVVLYAGRITALKGARVLAEAVGRARTLLGRDVHLVVAGEGPDRRQLERRANAVGLQASFRGWVAGDERTELFRKASIVVLPSLWPEPFGLVGLEAAAHGVPAVAFAAGGISEWLRDGFNGRLVDPAEGASALAAAMADVLRDPSTLSRLASGALATAADLNVDRHVSGLEQILRGVALKVSVPA